MSSFHKCVVSCNQDRCVSWPSRVSFWHSIQFLFLDLPCTECRPVICDSPRLMISNHQPYVLHIRVMVSVQLWGNCVLITNTTHIAILDSYLSCQGLYRDGFRLQIRALALVWQLCSDGIRTWTLVQPVLNTVFVLRWNTSVTRRTGKLGKGYESL